MTTSVNVVIISYFYFFLLGASGSGASCKAEKNLCGRNTLDKWSFHISNLFVKLTFFTWLRNEFGIKVIIAKYYGSDQ